MALVAGRSLLIVQQAAERVLSLSPGEQRDAGSVGVRGHLDSVDLTMTSDVSTDIWTSGVLELFNLENKLLAFF